MSGFGRNHLSASLGSSTQNQAWGGTDAIVKECDDGSWCCSHEANVMDCCDKGEGVWIENGEVTNTRPSNGTAPHPSSTSVAPTSSVVQSSPTSSKSTATFPTSEQRGALSEPRTIGIVMGVVGPCLILVGFAGFFVGRQHRCLGQKRLKSDRQQSHEMQYEDQTRELEAFTHCTELDATLETPVCELE